MTVMSVEGLMLTVPENDSCSCEHVIVSGAIRKRSYVRARRSAIAHATAVSVMSGRRSPYCSKLPIGRTAATGRRRASSADVAVVRIGGRCPPRRGWLRRYCLIRQHRLDCARIVDRSYAGKQSRSPLWLVKDAMGADLGTAFQCVPSCRNCPTGLAVGSVCASYFSLKKSW